jgi:anti-sigma factor RsiW
MQHLTEEELTLLYYREPGGSPEGELHLDTCERCRVEYSRLERALDAVNGSLIPERGPDYEAQVWRSVAPAILTAKRPVRRWIAVAIAAALIVEAFLAGRASRREAPVQAAVRQQVLLVAIGDHLERSRMVLVELANTDAPKATRLDISFEQGVAEDLLEANRLYRQTAVSTGDLPTANMLEDLERVLMEIVHSPPAVSAPQLEDLRQQIEDRKILSRTQAFKEKL